jgi:WD40 repeat protein
MSTIVKLEINQEHGQALSLSIDKTIKIWDLRSHTCIQTFVNEIIHRVDSCFTAFLYNPEGRGLLVVGSNRLCSYKLESKDVAKNVHNSHDFPVRVLLYNSVFNQLVSGCDGGVINVWDVSDGTKSFRFAETHGDAEITGIYKIIIAMAFDSSQRRLITGGRSIFL